MKHDVVILGAGPAGLACAIAVARNTESKNKRVLLLEKNQTPGKKLLITGTGQCNLTHAGDVDGFFTRYGPAEKGRFVKPALLHFTNRDLCAFFIDRGVELEETDNGKIFPRSRKASDILDVLCRECERYHVHIATGSAVLEVKKTNEKPFGFLIRTHKTQFQAEHFVIAAGGCSYPSTGSTGDGFRIAAEDNYGLGHTLAPIRPGLTPVTLCDHRLADCSGIAVERARISLIEKPGTGKTLRSNFGPILLTHTGISGPGVLDFSRYVCSGDFLCINWLGDVTPETLDRELQMIFADNGKRSLKKNLASTGLPERMIVSLLTGIGVTPETQSSFVEKSVRRKIVSVLTSHLVQVQSLGGFREAMCTCGGVSLKEVDAKTMRSRIVENLSFCGEVLDIDGDTGGYNLQFAFSSGFLAGNAIAKDD